jgi:hypothetical protein
LGHKDFTCSNGWLDRFKNRNNIVYAKISGEALSANTDTASEWVKSVWPELKKDFITEFDCISFYLTKVLFAKLVLKLSMSSEN